MATKPTKRILDWASGGTATDPGGSKEAAGWVVSERPPAFWWNWILQSFGDWLSWAEDSIDEVPSRARTRALGRISTPGGSVSTPVLQTDSIGLDTPQSGDASATEVKVRFATAFTDTNYIPIVTSASWASGPYVYEVAITSVSDMNVVISDDTGAVVNPYTTAVAFWVDVKGDQ